MKARIDKVLAKAYDIKLNKYIAWCLLKVGDDWRCQRLFFSDAEPWEKLREGDFVNIE